MKLARITSAAARASVHLALATAASASASAAHAADQPKPEVLQLTGHYQARVNDALTAEAKLYLTPPGATPKLLVIAPGLAQPVLVTAGEKTVVPVDPVRIVGGEAESITLAPGASAVSPGQLTIDGTRLRFVSSGVRVVVEPRDPLLGERTLDDLLAFMPEYRRNAAAYHPRRGDLRLLGTIRDKVEIDVYFGTWCPHCEQVVPRLIRVVQDLKSPNLAVRFHGLPTRINDDPTARQLKLEGVPTGFIRRGGEIVATFTGENLVVPEQALAAALLYGSEGR